jgi:hypothetical protein
MAELEQIFEKRKKAKKDKNLSVLAECSRQMLDLFGFEDVRHEAAYFFGRLKDYEGFGRMLQNAKDRAMNINERHRTYDVERRYFNIGLQYPCLEENDLLFLEEKYLCSGDYEMIDRMLFDKERLPRVLKHFDPNAYNIRNEDFSDEFLDRVFKAAWKNELELNVDEAIDNRYNSQTQNETWGRFFNCQYDPNSEPIFVYNRKTNQVEVDRSNLHDVMLFPIHNLGTVGYLLDEYKKFFGNEVEEFIRKTILPSCGIVYVSGWKDIVFPCIWYQSVNSGVIRKFEIPADDVRLKQIRRDIARQWLNEVNNKPLI